LGVGGWGLGVGDLGFRLRVQGFTRGLETTLSFHEFGANPSSCVDKRSAKPSEADADLARGGAELRREREGHGDVAAGPGRRVRGRDCRVRQHRGREPARG